MSCNNMEECRICNKAERDSVSAFIERSIKPANNMSDEEMEDVISQLEQTGIRIKCRTKYILVGPNGNPVYYKKKQDEVIYRYY